MKAIASKSPIDLLVNEYRERLIHVAGLQPSTCQQWTFFVRLLLNAQFKPQAPGLQLRNGQVDTFHIDSGLASENVRSVLCDDGRRLWAVAEGELRIFEEGRWRAPGGWSPISQNVRSISQSRDGGLWIATTVGLAGSQDSRVYKLKDGQSSAQLQPYPWPADSQQFQRLALLEDRSGRIWCATAGGVFFHTPGGSWQRLLSVAPWVQVEVLCLAEDENGLVWMGTRTTGLLQVQKRQVLILPLPSSASRQAVLTACASRDGSVV